MSPAALDYLEQLIPDRQDDSVIGALPFAAINGRPRIWSTDFALLSGARTEAEVDEWLASHRVRRRARGPGGLRVP